MPESTRMTVEQLLTRVAELGATDLHLTVGMPPVVRRDGVLVPLNDEAVVTDTAIRAITDALLPASAKAAFEQLHSARFTYTLGEKARFVATVFLQKGNPALSLRAIPGRIPTIAELGLPAVVQTFAQAPEGLVIIAGPAHSGRTTTLAAMAQQLNSERAKHIVTLESPIEFLYVNDKSIIEQRSVGDDTPSYVAGIADCATEDVDVVVIANGDDTPVMTAALDLAATGTLVLTAVRAERTVQVLEHMLAGVPQEQQSEYRSRLAASLRGICVQRLLPKVGGGMVLAAEVLTVSSAVRSILRDGSFGQLQTMLQTSRDEGMVPMDRALLALVKQGDITGETAQTYAQDSVSLQQQIRVGGYR